MEKKDLLKETVKHIDIKKYDSTELIDAMRHMSFTSRDTARAADILCQMIAEKDCTNILTIAGSTSAAGCMQVYVDMVRNKMVDAVVSTGASIIDMDLFEALGYKHYIGTKENVIPDTQLRELYIDRIYDTFIDEEELQACDQATCDGQPHPDLLRVRRAHLLPRLQRQQRRLRHRQAPVAPQTSRQALCQHRQRGRLPRAHRDQDELPRERPLHGRRRHPQELRPGHRRLRRNPRQRGSHA